jgi:hypothetical protein
MGGGDGGERGGGERSGKGSGAERERIRERERESATVEKTHHLNLPPPPSPSQRCILPRLMTNMMEGMQWERERGRDGNGKLRGGNF